MSKKSFKGGFEGLLNGPAENTQKSTPLDSKVSPIIVEEVRATFIVDQAKYDKLKTISFLERMKIKETLDNALGSYIKQYEKENGKLSPPKKRD